jgi:hypothetical protein
VPETTRPTFDLDTPTGIRKRAVFVLTARLDDGTRVWCQRIEVTECYHIDGVWNSGAWRAISRRRHQSPH